MATSLSDEEISDFKNIFELLDVDQGGSISSEELFGLLDSLGFTITKEEVRSMIGSVDADGSGEIEFEEFLQIIMCDINRTYSRDEVLDSFKLFSGDAPEGCIHMSNIELALTKYGGSGKMTQKEAEDIMCQIDAPDGIFNYKHHCLIMMD